MTREELIVGYIAQTDDEDMKTLLKTIDVDDIDNIEPRVALSLRGGYTTLLPDDTDFTSLDLHKSVRIKELEMAKDRQFDNIVVNDIVMTREIVYDFATIHGLMTDTSKQSWINVNGEVVELTKSDVVQLIVGGKNARQETYFSFRGKVQEVLGATTIEEVEKVV